MSLAAAPADRPVAADFGGAAVADGARHTDGWPAGGPPADGRNAAAQHAASEPGRSRSLRAGRRPILFVSHAAEIGGAEVGLIDIASHAGPAHCRAVLFHDGPLRPALERRGIGVTVLAAGGRVLGVRRASGLGRLLAALPEIGRLTLALAREARSCRLLYANSQKAAAIGMAAGLIARKPVIWHLHDSLDASHFAWPQRRLMAIASRFCTRAVVVVSEAAGRAFVASGGNPRTMHTILNGVDPAPFAGLHTIPRGALRASLGLPPGRLVGLFGRITAWKGQAVLIEALTLLPDVQALIVGAPLFGEDAELARLRALAARLGVASRVHFLGARADVPRLMRAADLVVHCSTAPEPFGRVIVEAVLAGTPVLAASGGASREILGSAEWLAPPGEPAALADAIGRMLDADTEAALAALRTRMLAQFTLARALRDYESLLA